MKKVKIKNGMTSRQQGSVMSRFKVATLSAAVTSLICASMPNTYASDIEIYKVPEDSVGSTTLMMMLDLSGSMGYGVGYNNTSMSIQEDYSVVASNGTLISGVCHGSRDNVKSDSTTTSHYTRYYCEIPSDTSNKKVTGYWFPSDTDPQRKWVAGCEAQKNTAGGVTSYRCYDRLTRLKDGLRQVLEGTENVGPVSDRIIMGLSTFAGSNGFVRVPARPLDEVIRSYKVMETYWEDEEYQELVTIGSTTETYTFAKPRWRKYTNTTPGKTCEWWQIFCTPTAASTKTYYQTCNWNTATSTCSWPTATESEPNGFNQRFASNVCSQGNNNDCREFYEEAEGITEVPLTEWQTKTRPVQKQREVTKNVTQRDLLLETIKDLQANGGTPTPYAYAEAAAYLLGTNTSIGDYNIRFYQTLGNRRTNGTSNYPCMSGNSVIDTYRQYKKADGSPITIRWCNDENKSWTPPTTATSLIYGRDNGGYDRELFYYANDPKSATASDGADYSGFSKSVSDSILNSNYAAPVSITSQKTNTAKRECSGQGIYFLTDGQPQPGGWAVGDDGQSGTAYAMMKQALGTKGSDFSCAASPLGKRADYDRPENGWACVGKLAQALLDPTQNPTGLKIQTAVVGFGSSFGAGGVESDDVKDAKDWGVVGDGGWIAGSSPEDVSDSINKFIKQLNKDIPSMSTGSSTIPLDALNPAVVQAYAYFPQFEPKVKPEDTHQIWFGNLKKYYVINNGVYSSKTFSNDTVVVKQSKLQDLSDIWNNPNISYPEGTAIFKKGGALNQLSLGAVLADEKVVTGRKLLTDYAYDGEKSAGERVSKNLNLTQIQYTYTKDAKTKSDTTYARALMGLLGYVIPNNTATEDLDLSSQAANLRQMGSVYHSKPLLLTQSGKAEATKVEGKVVINSSNRDDYVLFGSTQGLLQVVDADTGVEKFAFVPKEIIEGQSETFKQDGGNLAAGKDALYYGIDGEWAAHTDYVSKSDGSLTVGSADRGILGSVNNETETLTGKQWVYGGMRMGGRSYYALDLTDIDKPKVKFHIDPSTGTVYSLDKPNGTKYAALEKMGQSWSKPSIGYVNWKGQRKLVMIVGGGYDAGGDDGDGLKVNGIRTGYEGYEKYNYDQKNAVGAGVYMFDADTGDLLWNTNSTSNASLKYSVVSQIRTIDRNNDGVIDHLYFGDLAGQAFRVDFKNDGNKDSFTSQTTKVLDLHKSDGTSPRFYTLPVFTAHSSAGSTTMFGGNTVVVTFVSGNQSSPLLATSDSPQKKDPTDLQFDGVYAIFDYDVYPSTKEGRYPTSAIAARSLGGIPMNDTAMDKTKLRYINGATTATAINKDTGWGGWYYQFDTKIDGSTKKGASVIKGLTTPIAMDGSLYVTQFDASDNGTTSSCGAGVKGHSFSQRFCLPSGVCQGGGVYIYNLGSGIVTLNVGSADGDPNARSLVVPDPNDTCPAGQTCVPNGKPKFITAGGPLHFIPNRWYEKYSQ